jgi:hypothetical protein
MTVTQSCGDSSFPQLRSAKRASPRDRYSSRTITLTHTPLPGHYSLAEERNSAWPRTNIPSPFQTSTGLFTVSLLTCVWTASQEQLLEGMWSVVLTVQQSYLCNRQWMPIGIWHAEDPMLSRQSAHRWRYGCQPNAPAALYYPVTLFFCFRYSFLLEAE